VALLGLGTYSACCFLSASALFGSSLALLLLFSYSLRLFVSSRVPFGNVPRSCNVAKNENKPMPMNGNVCNRLPPFFLLLPSPPPPHTVDTVEQHRRRTCVVVPWKSSKILENPGNQHHPETPSDTGNRCPGPTVPTVPTMSCSHPSTEPDATHQQRQRTRTQRTQSRATRKVPLSAKPDTARTVVAVTWTRRNRC
jgi:hypothetical protein